MMIRFRVLLSNSTCAATTSTSQALELVPQFPRGPRLLERASNVRPDQRGQHRRRGVSAQVENESKVRERFITV
jgi:hypothetical protein